MNENGQKRERILVVDDTPENIDILRGILKDGYAIMAATNGPKALKIAASGEPPDLIILDIVMPGMDGFEVCRQLKGNPATRDIPIVMVTALIDRESRIRGLEAGADDFVSKPVDHSEIFLRVRNLLQIKEYRDFLKSCNETLEQRVRERTAELEKAFAELKSTQELLVMQEKMASIGQLAAGIAHEINNPVGFIASNLGSLNKYGERLLEFIAALDLVFRTSRLDRQVVDELSALRVRLKIDHILKDLPQLIRESLDGADRVKGIVLDMKRFSRMDDGERKLADINQCLESTLHIVNNELKYKARITRDYAELPQILCYSQQLNQVFTNLLVNAAHAIEKQGEITVRTWQENNSANISVTDTGCGISDEIRSRIFEPFFTTKEVGKGTGLGLSISYDIVKKHGGDISVESTVGNGTTFTIRLPLNGEAGLNCGHQ